MVSFERVSQSEQTLLKHYNLKINYSQDIKQQIFSKLGFASVFN